jgi:hypothetical protein
MARLKTRTNDITDYESIGAFKKLKKYIFDITPNFFADAITTGPFNSSNAGQPIVFYRHTKTISVDETFNATFIYEGNTLTKPTIFVWHTVPLGTQPLDQRQSNNMFTFRLAFKNNVLWGEPLLSQSLSIMNFTLIDGTQITSCGTNNIITNYFYPAFTTINSGNLINYNVIRQNATFNQNVFFNKVKLTFYVYDLNDLIV